MKQSKVFWLLPIILGSAGVAEASWLDGRPYVGGAVGYTVFDTAGEAMFGPKSNRGYFDSSSLTKNDYGFTGFAGWGFHSGYALELSYAEFGDFDSKVSFMNGGQRYIQQANASMDGKGIGMRYDWAASNAMNLYGRAGVMRWETTWDVDQTIDGADRTRLSSSNLDGTDFYVGVGGQYELIHNLFLYTEAFYLDAQFDKNGFRNKFHVYSLYGGLMFRFGDAARRTGSTEKRARESTACDPKYKDISGVACE